jgi:hypothetical protein
MISPFSFWQISCRQAIGQEDSWKFEIWGEGSNRGVGSYSGFFRVARVWSIFLTIRQGFCWLPWMALFTRGVKRRRGYRSFLYRSEENNNQLV